MLHKIFSLRPLATAAFLMTLGFATVSCDDMVEVDPQNSLDLNAGLQTTQDVAAGLNGAYDNLQSANYYGLRYPTFADMGADNVRWRGTFPSFNAIYINTILPDNTELVNMWNTIYVGINRANYVMEQAEKISDPAFTAKNSTIAEARLLRAFHYMNLIGFWGGTPQGYGYANGVGVPLRLTATTTPAQATTIPRSSEQEVLTAIRNDMEFAIANLPNTNTSKARLSKAAAYALKARLALRVRDYQTAADAAAQVSVAQPALTLVPDYEAIFRDKNTAESIWELQFDATDANQFAFFWYPAANGGRNEVGVNTTLASAHETGDKRLPVNVAAAPAGTTRKYTRTDGSDNFVVIRYAEVVLTRAEALANVGGAANLTQAITLLNTVRSRAGLTPLVATTSQADLIAAILKERRIELAHEGHRWFDLRRTNTVQTAIPSVTQTFRNLWPIPQREILTSAPLGGGTSVVVQNEGY